MAAKPVVDLDPAIARVREEGRLREAALQAELDKVREERYLHAGSYPPALRSLEKENSRLRVELQLQQGHVLSLSNEVLRLGEELRELRSVGSLKDDMVKVSAEMTETVAAFAAAGSRLAATTEEIRDDRRRGVYPVCAVGAVEPEAAGGVVAAAAALHPPAHLSRRLYQAFVAAPSGRGALDMSALKQVFHDGSTLYRTLAVLLLGSEDSHASLRAEVAQHLRQGPSPFAPFLAAGETVTSYADAVGAGAPGDLLALKAACDRFKAAATVHVLPRGLTQSLLPFSARPLIEVEVAVWSEAGREVYCPVKR